MVSSGLSRVSVTGGTFHSGYFSSVIRVSPLLPECQVTFINLDIKFLQHLVRYFLPQFCTSWSVPTGVITRKTRLFNPENEINEILNVKVECEL